jgi:DNA invertase Pin-like site-specific DNA recombinase
MKRIIGLIRPSPKDPTGSVQRNLLTKAGCRQFMVIRSDQQNTAASSAADRWLSRFQPGDHLVVTQLSQLGRSALATALTVVRLRQHRVKITAVKDRFRTDAFPGDDEALVTATVALIEGHADAQANKPSPKTLGRPKALGTRRTQAAKCLRTQGFTQTEVAEMLGVSRSTIQRLSAGTSRAGASVRAGAEA